MTRRPARLRVAVGLVALVIVLAAAAAAVASGGGRQPSTSIEIVIRYSKFEPAAITVPVGVPVTITLRNEDPIDHEWIAGDAAVHAVHRVGTEPIHPDHPAEVFIPAMESRTTTITFAQAGSLAYICHLPAHEAYGMVGTMMIR